jgi:xanthine dehydrogenase YagT iron-sulfur-binding subunit
MSDSVSIGPEVGSAAPELAVSGIDRRAGHGEPRVLAFLHDGLGREPAEALGATGPSGASGTIRAELRGLGAELVIVSPGGIWAVRPDDPVEALAGAGAALADEVAAAAQRYGVLADDEAVFVVDGRGVVRFSYRLPVQDDAVLAQLARALALAGRAMHARDDHDPRQRVLFTRREWTVTCLVAGCAAAFLGCKEQNRQRPERRPPPPPPEDLPPDLDVTLTVNGARRTLRIDPRTSLLDALRERLGMTGTKKGCDAGQCGACTVLVGGKRVISCLTLAVMAQGKDITTIEGLARDGALHPVQAAFVAQDGLQCGYCTPGQIMSAVGLIAENRATGDDEVREQMSGNLCRCGAYPNIIAAIQSARRTRG